MPNQKLLSEAISHLMNGDTAASETLLRDYIVETAAEINKQFENEDAAMCESDAEFDVIDANPETDFQKEIQYDTDDEIDGEIKADETGVEFEGDADELPEDIKLPIEELTAELAKIFAEKQEQETEEDGFEDVKFGKDGVEEGYDFKVVNPAVGKETKAEKSPHASQAKSPVAGAKPVQAVNDKPAEVSAKAGEMGVDTRSSTKDAQQKVAEPKLKKTEQEASILS